MVTVAIAFTIGTVTGAALLFLVGFCLMIDNKREI